MADAPEQQNATIGAPTVGATARVPTPEQSPPPHQREDHVELFQGRDSDWYWRRRAGNGQIVATGGEGYVHRVDCVAAAQRINGPLLLIELVAEEPTDR